MLRHIQLAVRIAEELSKLLGSCQHRKLVAMSCPTSHSVLLTKTGRHVTTASDLR